MKAPARSRAADAVFLLLAVLAAWQLVSQWMGAQVLPSPWETVRQLGREFHDPDFAIHLWATFKAFSTAFLIASVSGVAAGLLLGMHRLAGEVMEPLLMALYSIPKIALYPVILLIFGLGLSAKIAFGVLHGIVPIVIFTLTAIRNIPRVYLRTSRAHRLGWWPMTRSVLMPAAMPEIVAGLRIGFSLTLLGTLLGEMFASQRGLGHLLMRAMERNDTAIIMALALLLFAFATSASMGLLYWGRRLRREGGPS